MAAVSPALIILGVAGTALAESGSSGSTCQDQGGLVGSATSTVCKTVSGVLPTASPSPSSLPTILPSPVTSAVSSVGSTVGSLTGGSGSPTPAPSPSPGSPTGSGGSGSGSHAKPGSHSRPAGSRGGVSALGATGAGTAGTSILSSLGVPAWLVNGGLGSAPGATVPLSFPVVHPAANAAAQDARATQATRAVSSLWLIFAVGVACLVGVAGGLGRFENRRKAQRIEG